MTISDNPNLRYSRAANVQHVLQSARKDDLDYMLQGGDKIRTGWMPFQLADFIAILSEVVIEAGGIEFLEVGSGVGTKSLVARELFGLNISGIEYDETLVTVAAQRGRGPVWQGDALAYPGRYDKADIIWMYRPFKDPVLQEQLEDRIYTEMKPGAIVAGGHLEHKPVGFWAPIFEDWDGVSRGAWKKLV
jgi:hypothetical protein